MANHVPDYHFNAGVKRPQLWTQGFSGPEPVEFQFAKFALSGS